MKTTTRRRNVERMEEYEQQSELHEDRGLPAPEPDPQPAEDPAGQVRQDAPELPEAVSPGTVQFDAPERDAVPASDGTGADGREPDAADHCNNCEQSVQTEGTRTQKTIKETSDKPCSHGENRCPSITHENSSP